MQELTPSVGAPLADFYKTPARTTVKFVCLPVLARD
jgi:hypothetical protein